MESAAFAARIGKDGRSVKKCKPIRSPRQAVVLLSVCVALAVVAAVFASVLATYRWAAQIIFLVLLVICIQIVVRYTLTEMEYAVGPNTFTVTKSVGRKETVVCSLELSTAIALLPKAEFKKNDKEKRYGVIGTRFNFNQNIRASSYVYVCEFNGRTVAIEFEPNAPFVAIMKDEIESRVRAATVRRRRRTISSAFSRFVYIAAGAHFQRQQPPRFGSDDAVDSESVIALKGSYGSFCFRTEDAVVRDARDFRHMLADGVERGLDEQHAGALRAARERFAGVGLAHLRVGKHIIVGVDDFVPRRFVDDAGRHQPVVALEGVDRVARVHVEHARRSSWRGCSGRLR